MIALQRVDPSLKGYELGRNCINAYVPTNANYTYVPPCGWVNRGRDRLGT